MSNRDDEYRQRSNDSRRQQQHGRRYPQSHQDRAAMPPPKEGEIFEGEIVRIEAYGAFCALLGTRWQGLIHISQLYDSRVEQVEDVVSLNDRVWVKVLQVEQQQNDDDTDRHPPRLRIKLSIKDVSQDGSRQDLGRQREEKEQVKTQLETNLNSMIGVAVARDPMENHRLLLKCNHNAANTVTTFRGGYTLVGDDEGEPAESEPKPDSDLLTNESRDLQLKPMGRGRGATLPAWMTAPSGDGPIGGKKDFSGLQSDPESGSDESRENKKRKRKRHKKPSRKEHKHRSKRSSKKNRKRSRHDDYSDESSRSDSYDAKKQKMGRRKQSEGDRGRNNPKSKKRRRHSRRSHRSDSDSSFNTSASSRSGGAR
ncbi:4-hydroxy-3-methylbut-2-en-1-yl diphosphate synthase [Nitzschia inconspicua]|uniref:4-hydroxy-3-methylbut-2-en-1-yl diphosphate synthase n=1 Tax=Nitzschia inconspicua TaxID=303405 RepID=A0A9K3LWQ2_9STRA|nr:4-hydroxy-3-methylbut-2-en-1-yl diphosphate synthase [Nitzschia inconspicua]